MSKLHSTVWQYVLAFAVAVVVVGGVSWGYHAHGQAAMAKVEEKMAVKDTVVVNTQAMAQDVIGFAGRTPLEIKLVDGVIVSVKALPNEETPGYFRRVEKSSLLTVPVGKTPAQVLEMELDAVSGATYSSKAVIENLRRGLQSVAE